MKSPRSAGKSGFDLLMIGLLACACLPAPEMKAQLSTMMLGTVGFSHEWDVGSENALFVVGSPVELGAWDVTRAVRLMWTDGNVWIGQVALPSGQTHEYKYVKRSMQPELYCDPGNVEWMPGENLSVTTPPSPPPPFAGKTVFYLSSWEQVNLMYRSGDTNWSGAAMSRAGPGRHAGEYLYRASGVGANGLPIEFVFNNGQAEWDNAPFEGPESGSWNYYTALDVFHVQDKQVFNYTPPDAVSAPRVVTTNVYSSVPEIAERAIRIYLPRGYDQNTAKRYPVFYLQDGQNVFSPGGSFGSWDVDLTATREISQGRVRECIIVGIDNNPPHRQVEYAPPGDRYLPEAPLGIGDKYLRFLADNVKPTLDWNYRTLTARADTFMGGSSMGGLISLYAGYATNLFGGILAMSPAMTRATNFSAGLWSLPKRDMRIYCDTGNNEGQVGPLPGGDYWHKPWEAYDALLNQRYSVNASLLMRIGCGHVHNEAAWAARLPEALRFLLDVRREAGSLAQKTHPPSIQVHRLEDGSPVFDCPTLNRFRYSLEHRTNLASGTWAPRLDPVTETNAWGNAVFSNISEEGFYRIVAEEH